MNAKEIIVTVLVLFGMFSSFAAAETPSNGNAVSGIEGVITISPAMPGPTHEGVSDTKPVANMAWVVQNEKGMVTSFNTDNDGRFRILLPPGHYTVLRKEPAGRIGRFGPFDVAVAPGKMTTVEWKCDSGMR